MHALVFIACDDLNVHFSIVVLVEKRAVTGAGHSAGLHRSAYTTVQNVFVLSRDLGSEDRRRRLTAGDLQLKTFIGDSHIGCSVKLREWG